MGHGCGCPAGGGQESEREARAEGEAAKEQQGSQDAGEAGGGGWPGREGAMAAAGSRKEVAGQVQCLVAGRNGVGRNL